MKTILGLLLAMAFLSQASADTSMLERALLRFLEAKTVKWDFIQDNGTIATHFELRENGHVVASRIDSYAWLPSLGRHAISNYYGVDGKYYVIVDRNWGVEMRFGVDLVETGHILNHVSSDRLALFSLEGVDVQETASYDDQFGIDVLVYTVFLRGNLAERLKEEKCSVPALMYGFVEHVPGREGDHFPEVIQYKISKSGEMLVQIAAMGSDGLIIQKQDLLFVEYDSFDPALVRMSPSIKLEVANSAYEFVDKLRNLK